MRQATPYGWRKYLASQEWYLRFCCYEMISRAGGSSNRSQAPVSVGPDMSGFTEPGSAKRAMGVASQGGTRVMKLVRQLSLVKGKHRYLFRYDAGPRRRSSPRLRSMAADPKQEFDWFDAAVMSYQMGRRLEMDLEDVKK